MWVGSRYREEAKAASRDRVSHGVKMWITPAEMDEGGGGKE